MISPWLLLGAGVGAIAAAGSIFFYGVEVGEDKVLARQKSTQEIVDAAIDARDLQVGHLLAKIEVNNVQLTQPVVREVRTNTVYRECLHTPDGLRALNAAIVGAPPQPTGDRQLPPADTPGK